MNVHEMSQSLHTMMEIIATTKLADHNVSNDLFQNCMACVANKIIQLVQSVDQLGRSLHGSIPELSNRLKSFEQITITRNENLSALTERVASIETNTYHFQKQEHHIQKFIICYKHIGYNINIM